MSVVATTVDRIAARAGQLYSLPAVAMKVLQLTDDAHVDARDLKQCIENDPALTGKILRVVNSSLFGLSRDVSDLHQALALLGIKPLKLLVLGFSLPGGLFAGVEAKVLGWYWRHTLTKAVAAREISQHLWKMPGDDAFVAGLLQDLGVLLLLQQLGPPYARFLDRALAEGRDLPTMEIQAMGFAHIDLSARLLRQWNLPATLVEAVAFRPPGVPAAALAQIVHLGELVARLLCDGQSHALTQLLQAGRAYHHLAESQLEGLIAKLEEKVQQLAAVLSLDLPAGLEYRDVLAAAQRQLANVATQAAEELLGGHIPGPLPPSEESLLAELQNLSQAVAQLKFKDDGSTEGDPCAATAAAPISPVAPAGDAASAKSCPGVSLPVAASAAWRAAPAPACRAASSATLTDMLSVAAAACRRRHCALSLMLVELDGMDRLLATLGVQGFEDLRQRLHGLCREVDHSAAICMPRGEAGFAIILPDCERRAALQMGDRLIQIVRGVRLPDGGGQSQPLGLGVGIATVNVLAKNFDPADLLARAERCLYSSHTSGAMLAKSIES
jgi:HD-like signal output (HDOD) protein/GGDEF domain-containing protein